MKLISLLEYKNMHLIQSMPTKLFIRSQAYRDIQRHFQDQPSEQHELIQRYFQQCGWSSAIMAGFADDPYARGQKGILRMSERSDGVFLWDATLEHLWHHYHFQLPIAFLLHMRKNNWVPPNHKNMQDLNEILKQATVVSFDPALFKDPEQPYFEI